LKQAPYEDILNTKVDYDFKIINEFSRYVPKDETFNRFFRIFEVKRRGEGIGVIRILDLELRGQDLIPSAIIEQIWAGPGHLRACLSALMSAMKREGKEIILSIFPLPGFFRRLTFFSLGFLPDYSRPVRLIMLPVNPDVKERLPEITTFSLPFR